MEFLERTDSVGKISLLIILPVICVFLSGCNENRLESGWRGHKIIIDAKFDDWGNAQTYYDEKEKTVVNLANDSEYFYICLITRNRGLEIRLMESGFVAWFDPDGGKNQSFGIRFPIGLKRMGMSLEEDKRDSSRDWYDEQDQSGVIDREKEKWQSKEFNKHLETIEDLQDKLEIVNGNFTGHKGNHPEPEKELNLDESAKLGIEAKAGRENDYFVYELKVPLVKSVQHPYAAGIKPGKPLGLGLEISKFSLSKGKGDKFDDDGGDDQTVSEIRPHNMRSDDVFQFWAIVTLASGPLASN